MGGRTKARRCAGALQWLALVLVAGCGGGPASPDISGLCIAGLQLGGRFYAHDGTLPAGTQAGESVGAVVREVGCYDTPGHGDPDDTVKFDGDSNFLPVGTTIHRVEGRSTTEVLTTHFQGEWLLLVAEEDTSEPTG